MVLKKNVASQIIGAQITTAADGTAFTGSVTCYYTLDGGTQTIGSVGSGVCTHEGNGFHTYTPTAGETNGDHVAYTFIGTGAIAATVQGYPTFPQTGDSYARLGAPAGASVSADTAAIKVDTAAVKVKTDFLPSATAGSTGGVFVAGTNAATTITTGLTTTFTGSLTGSVGSVTGNIGGNVTGTVAGVTPAAAGAAMALTSGERTTLAGVVLTTQMTESYRTDGSAPTIAQALCETLGHMGESSISGTTKTVKKFDGSTSAATFTLNDATTPTAITRAT